MALVIPFGYAHVVHSIVQASDPEPMAMTYGVEAQAFTTAAAIATDCANAFKECMAEVFSNQFTLVSTEVVFQDVDPGPPSIGVSAISQIGAGTDPVMPQNNAYLIHKRTATGGRSGRGRMFQPGVGEGAVNTIGQLTGAIQTALNTSYADLLADLAAAASIIGMVVLHDSLGAGALLPPYAVTSLIADPVISTQRRRLRH
jgi:hypothetical protein